MMMVFKILMLICTILSFMSSMVEKDTQKQKVQVASFASAGTLLLLAEVASLIAS